MLKRKDIELDPETGKFVICLSVKLCDGNPMMLEAKAKLYGSIMDRIEALVDAEVAEFAERYGEEVIKFAHNNIGDDLGGVVPIPPKVKFVNSKEVQQRLLLKAFKD